MRAHEFVLEKKKKKRRPRWAAYGPGPYGGYGYYAGYSGDSGEGGDGGGGLIDPVTKQPVKSAAQIIAAKPKPNTGGGSGGSSDKGWWGLRWCFVLTVGGSDERGVFT